jgi:hypothetical protein
MELDHQSRDCRMMISNYIDYYSSLPKASIVVDNARSPKSPVSATVVTKPPQRIDRCQAMTSTCTFHNRSPTRRPNRRRLNFNQSIITTGEDEVVPLPKLLSISRYCTKIKNEQNKKNVDVCSSSKYEHTPKYATVRRNTQDLPPQKPLRRLSVEG